MSAHRAHKRNRDKAGHFQRTRSRAPRPGPKPHPEAVPLLDRDGNMTGWQWADPALVLDRYKPKRCALNGCDNPPMSKDARYCSRSHSGLGAKATREANLRAAQAEASA